MKTLCQIAQAPTHDPMERRGSTVLHDRRKRLTLGIDELGSLTGRLAIDQPIRAAGIERMTQSRTICRPTPPIRAASLRLPAS